VNILVTGASKGIGKTTALELKNIGNVFVTARNEEALKSLNCSGCL
jgi:short-subunit dehydrogenase